LRQGYGTIVHPPTLEQRAAMQIGGSCARSCARVKWGLGGIALSRCGTIGGRRAQDRSRCTNHSSSQVHRKRKVPAQLGDREVRMWFER
jgi:hypothetical protein